MYGEVGEKRFVHKLIGYGNLIIKAVQIESQLRGTLEC